MSRIAPATAITVVPTLVTIHGERLDAAATVTIGNLVAQRMEGTDTTIVVITPVHAAGTVDVVVRNPDSQSAQLSRGFAFEDVPSVAPSIQTILPALGVTTGGTGVEITGTGFDARTSVSIDGVPVRTFLSDPGALSIATPPHAAGAVDAPAIVVIST